MERTNEDLKVWANIVQNAELEKDIDDAKDQTLISTGRNQILDEMPMVLDTFSSKDEADNTIRSVGTNTNSSQLVKVKEHPGFSVFKSPDGNNYYAYNDNGKLVGYVEGTIFGKNILKIELSIKDSSSTEAKVISSILSDITASGIKVLTGLIQSPSAKSFWERMIMSGNHKIYVVIAGEVKEQAKPERMKYYWHTDPDEPGSYVQFLMLN